MPARRNSQGWLCYFTRLSRNRASSRVLETIFATELQRVLAGDFRLTLAVRRRTVRVVVSSVKGDLDGRCLIAGCSFEKPPRL